MSSKTDKHWLVAVLIVWTLTLLAAIAAVCLVHRQSLAILNRLVSGDPAPARQALRLRLEADRLVHEALLRHEAATSATAAVRITTGALVSEVVPLLEQAERLYLQSLDAASSQPALLFQLGEVSLLRGQSARGYLYLARYWNAIGEKGLARAYRRMAAEVDASTTIPLLDDAAPTVPGN